MMLAVSASIHRLDSSTSTPGAATPLGKVPESDLKQALPGRYPRRIDVLAARVPAAFMADPRCRPVRQRFAQAFQLGQVPVCLGKRSPDLPCPQHGEIGQWQSRKGGHEKKTTISLSFGNQPVKKIENSLRFAHCARATNGTKAHSFAERRPRLPSQLVWEACRGFL